MNPFALPIDWQALTTLITGIVAVGGAVLVANRQIELRRNEVRVTLFQQRQSVLKRFRELAGEWQVGARLKDEKMRNFSAVVKDIELIFDEETYAAAAAIFKDTTFQNMFARHATMFSVAGDETRRLAATENEQARLEQIADKLPELDALLVRATQVGHVFR